MNTLVTITSIILVLYILREKTEGNSPRNILRILDRTIQWVAVWIIKVLSATMHYLRY